MQKINQKLTVGTPKKGLDLYCNIKVDGETKRRFRSKSFLGSFASILQGKMHGGGDPKIGWTDVPSSSTTANEWFPDPGYEITSYTAANPGRVEMNYNYLADGFVDYDGENPSYIVIVNAGDWDGVYYGKEVSSGVFDLYDFDGNPIDASAFSTPSTTGHMTPAIGWVNYMSKVQYDEHGFQSRMAKYWEIIVGESDTPVDVRDVYCHKRIVHGSSDGTLSHGTVNVSAQVTDKPTSKITLTKSFTNQGATTIDVKELVVCTQMYRERDIVDFAGFGIVRDVLGSPLSVPAGATLTVDYELVIRLSPDTLDTEADGTNGGLLAEFMRLLRELAVADSNQPEEVLQVATNAGTCFLGDRNMYADDGTSSDTSGFGLKLGTVNKYVSMTDTTLDPDNNGAGEIDHGEADGQLYHYATNVELLEYDTANDKATFKISRIFENRGSTSITIGEMGIYAIDDYPNSDIVQYDTVLIARTALETADQFTFNPGDYKQVVYTVEVQA